MDIDFEKEIGKKIKYFREKNKMTQENLAVNLQVRGCDITRSAVAKIEVGQRHIYADELRLIKEILGISFDELFY